MISPYFTSGVISYMLGSIPSGYLLVRIFTGQDVRASGSGNIGSTNVARKSLVLGIATLVFDVSKGLAAVLLTRALFSGPHQRLILTSAAFFAVFGHLFPVWLGFHGGKGVATSLGAFVFLTPKSILCMVALFLVVAIVTRYISLASLCATLVFPVLVSALHEYVDWRQLILIVLISALVIWKHRQNIVRLISGTESQFGTKLGSKSETLGATGR
ncbi:MAG TPA: glycerol-3-phosphate 1-O-acyltransferase PlsY [Terriglobales bacterium]|jgi:glycerol-3-phosphate acyltransferase PlsY|nr:glycerol-3-phosphate 1-O-acyltransferase PlsY [Terriglobales bacterium]